MILADASVIIRYWKKPTDVARQVFASGNVVIAGVTRSELLHGALSDRDAKRISEALDPFIELKLHNSIWTDLGLNLYKLRTKGITVPFQDALIASLAIHNDVAVWSDDTHFKLMQTALPKLKLFAEA